MNPKPLSQDLTDALHAAGGEPLPVIDPSNQHVYLVVDRKIHQQAMRALRHQEMSAATTWHRKAANLLGIVHDQRIHSPRFRVSCRRARWLELTNL